MRGMHGASVARQAGSIRAAMRAEFLKGRRAAARKVALIAPLPMAALGFAASGALPGMGGAGGAGFGTYGWNYWYVLMLPVAVALVTASVANLDVRHGLRGVLGLPVEPRRIWWAKAVHVLALTLTANAVVLAVGVLARAMGGAAPSIVAGLLCAVLLTLAVAWMVPTGLFLTMRLGTLAGIALPLLAQVALGIVFAAGGLWWAVPMAVGMRLASPLIGVAPSGVPLLPGDPMLAIDGAWFAGLAVALLFAVGLSAAGAAWFSRKETM